MAMGYEGQIKLKLLERKSELESDLQRLTHEKVSDDQVQDAGDQAVTSSLEEINISLQRKKRDEYVLVLKALELLEKGEYGICIDCGQSISEKRLMINLNASRCLACQELFEEREG